VVGLRVLRVERDGALVVAARLFDLAELAVGEAAVGVGVRVFVVGGDGFVEIFEPPCANFFTPRSNAAFALGAATVGPAKRSALSAMKSLMVILP
jgi:hypothetical protein